MERPLDTTDGRSFPFTVLPELAAILKAQRERTEALEKAQGRIIPWVFHNDGNPIRDFRKAWVAA